MKALGRLSLVVGVLGLLVVVAHHLVPEWADRMGLDFRRTLRLLGEMDRSQQRMKELDLEVQTACRRIDFKNRLTEDLIAGRCTLREAARRLRQGEALSVAYLEELRRRDPGQADLDLLCRHLLVYTDGALRGRPERAAVVARLEAELRAGPALSWDEPRKPPATASGGLSPSAPPPAEDGFNGC